jgi:hypothetical protein
MSMGSWNYRVIKRKIEGGSTFGLHEVYYKKNGKIVTWSEDAIAPYGEKLKGLKADLKLLKKAFEMPTLKEVVSKKGRFKLKALKKK